MFLFVRLLYDCPMNKSATNKMVTSATRLYVDQQLRLETVKAHLVGPRTRLFVVLDDGHAALTFRRLVVRFGLMKIS